MRGRSVKPEYRLAPRQGGTPPPPEFEPLSPILPPSALSVVNPAGGKDKNTQHHNNGTNGVVHHSAVYGQVNRGHFPRGSLCVSYDQPLRSAPLQRPNAQYSPGLGSPIDALANAAVSSLGASPVFAEPSRRPSHGPLSPATIIPFFPSNRQAVKHPYPDDTVYPYDERPSKRARSELFPSPQNVQYASRPATSHIPLHGWSYNVEQMVDSGMRMCQANGVPIQPQEDSSSKRLSDAQLLLDFHHAVSASHPAQAQVSTTKRWSVSHADMQGPHSTQPVEAPSLYLGPPYSDKNRPDHTFRPVDYTYRSREEQLPNSLSETNSITAAVQTHTPPEDTFNTTIPPATPDSSNLEEKKPKKHQGWPKGKPRGPRTGTASGKKKKATPKAKGTASTANSGVPDQLHSPQSLPADENNVIPPEDTRHVSSQRQMSRELASQTRRHSISNLSAPGLQCPHLPSGFLRARSVPIDTSMSITPPADESNQISENNSHTVAQITICAGCNSSDSHTLIGEGEQWIRCDGCKGWFHFVCAGFKNEREVRDVDKFYCGACSPKFGKTTKVRKSGRAHTSVDYAGLNEGILKTSDDSPEHHYITAIKKGDLRFDKETFARISPEFVTAEYFEKTNGFREPVVIPAFLNPRPNGLGTDVPISQLHNGSDVQPNKFSEDQYGYELVPDDGQDKIDMVIPDGLTIRRVAELYGTTERVDVIDVKSQEGEDKRWTMGKWADYYEQEGEKPVRNVISLEVSQSKLGRLIRRPKAVRDMDLQDSIWPEEDKANAPKVQFYCLMSVADCYTDFHIDFGGSSVYYHIIKGKKTFFFIPPTKQNLKKYEDWCLSPKQSHEFLGRQVKECYRVDLSAGDTMLIPSGWIHAVWTPEDSLVIGGNFLTRIHYGMQIKVAEVEKNTKVAKKFRYPFFQKVMWFSILKYLEEDPLPPSVVGLLQNGGQFQRSTPIYCETNKFGHNSDLGPENYNARYYSKAELDGLPDLANYIWRTVMISLGRVEGIAVNTRNAVTRSIPKGRGDALTLARNFAMWAAWKRGNENLPQWAHPEALLPEAADSKGEKKLSAAQLKKMERESWNDALRAARDRQPSRVKTSESPTQNGPENQVQRAQIPLGPTSQPASAEPAKHLSTPKTSQLGPKRIACDACRKRRIRCKHKDELADSSKSGGTVVVPSSGLISSVTSPLTTPSGPSVKRRQSEADISVTPVMNSTIVSDTPVTINGGLLPADMSADVHANKSGRVKACPDCRKSKRRCIHDENGNVDPVKASEAPVPRGSASKKRRVSEGDGEPSSKKMKKEVDDELVNGGQYFRKGVQNSRKGPEIGDMVTLYDPRTTESVEFVLNASHLPQLDEGDTISVAAPSNVPASDAILSSIENHSGVPMDGVEEAAPEGLRTDNPEHHTPTPISNPHPQVPNGVKEAPPSSPLTDLARSTSPDNNHITVSVPPDSTPTASRLSRMGSSGRKMGQTPGSSSRKSSTPKSAGVNKGRRDSKGSIKVEPKARTLSSTEDEHASLRLAVQLQMEMHGLRRRSK
ncbi:hypothetical protein K469DRAFT_544639 [Zopfia rhizophila CBS 207.26]|uniref:JmjC domain-containing histone demethylation protein 1 n=1 Tax=Zopfia rhizophila CBS 207.26 TaxID=1314779 RepID=A0A6A6EYJ1_9PEZI|nr:hypothetical protein K469DRAFT_544639 [Zopfia rhizophila CBS 207.26]